MAPIANPLGLNAMPSGDNLWNQIHRSNRRRAKGDVEQLRRQIWHSLRVAADAIDNAVSDGDQEIAIKWTHVQLQMSNAYLKILEAAEVAPEIAEIKKRLEGGGI